MSEEPISKIKLLDNSIVSIIFRKQTLEVMCGDYANLKQGIEFIEQYIDQNDLDKESEEELIALHRAACTIIHICDTVLELNEREIQKGNN